MKAEKTNSGKWRIRPFVNGVRYSITFDHKPNKQEIEEEINKKKGIYSSLTFQTCCEEYISIKANVLSPSTIKEYKRIVPRISPALLNKKVCDITQVDIQTEINKYSIGRSPKTVRNYHGFISSVLQLYNPSLVLHTTMPQKVKNEPYIPSQDEVIRLLEATEDSKYWICYKLACYGLRRSEICALTLDDIDVENKTIRIDKALVENDNKEWIIKTTKTTDSTRTIYVDEELINRIVEQGYIFNGYPNRINQQLTKELDRLGIEHFTLHKLRHFFASQLYEKGYDTKAVQEAGGWKTDSKVLQNVYRHSMNKEEKARAIPNAIFN